MTREALKETPEALEACGVRLAFGAAHVLQGVTFSLQPGALVALVGANGAGKSSLLEVLAGLRAPSGGEARLGGAAVPALPLRERARRIAFLPQSAEVAWRLDVETLVGLGRLPWRQDAGRDAAAVAAAMAAADVAGLGRRDVRSLSGGERARVLLARALAGEPQWLLADEPMSGLDLRHQLDLGRLLRRQAEAGAGVVLSLHDLTFAARFADRVLVMKRGAVIADGPPQRALRPDVVLEAFDVAVRWTNGDAGPVLDILAAGGRG